MLMDQPPSAESPPCQPDWTPAQRRAAGWNAVARLSAGRIEAFAAISEHLRQSGLSAPEVQAADAELGLAVLEDMGDDLFARVIEAGEPQLPLYLAAVEAVATLHMSPGVPQVLRGAAGDWPMLTYDAVALQGGADLFLEWLPKLHPVLAIGPAAREEWGQVWAPVVAMGEAGASVLTHRDYHAENLLWLPDRIGPARVGLIDFQDAVIAHPMWDLHSLLQDARRDVPRDLERSALNYYCELTGADREQSWRDYVALAALNEARILGVFARLAARDGKPRYRAFMPRMWLHLRANLAEPGLEDVADWFRRHIPERICS